MLKFFFNLYFQYALDNETEKETITSTFNLGYYSSNKKANDAISIYKSKPGFCEHDLDCFKIQRFGVKFENDIDKEQVDLFELSYEEENAEYDEWTLFGVFSTEKLAKEEQLKQQVKRRYKNNIDGFYINKWKVNICSSWQEGFDKIL